MTKREARLAAFCQAVVAIDLALLDGWESLDQYGADREQVEDALRELSEDLMRRAGIS